MKGWAIIKTPTAYLKVPHDSDDESGLVPQKTKDGQEVWKWSHTEKDVDTVIAGLTAFRNRQGKSTEAETTDGSTKAKGGRK